MTKAFKWPLGQINTTALERPGASRVQHQLIDTNSSTKKASTTPTRWGKIYRRWSPQLPSEHSRAPPKCLQGLIFFPLPKLTDQRISAHPTFQHSYLWYLNLRSALVPRIKRPEMLQNKNLQTGALAPAAWVEERLDSLKVATNSSRRYLRWNLLVGRGLTCMKEVLEGPRVVRPRTSSDA